MQRHIPVSTDVYAAIWAARQPGENDENDILARVLNCQATKPLNSSLALSGSGVHDTRNNVHFPEGFVIFRSYKGAKYEAVASNGLWHRKDNGATYPTLNQLNSSIAKGAENVWNGNWRYIDLSGSEKSINSLRP